VLLQQRESTKESLGKETDAAIILQLTCILLYQQSTGAIVNLPGRNVPTVLEALKVDLVEEHYSKLIKFQSKIYQIFNLASVHGKGALKNILLI